MRKFFKVMFIGLALTLVLGACDNSATNDEVPVSNQAEDEKEEVEINDYGVPVDAEKEIIQMIRDNLEAANNHDVDTYVSHLLPEDDTEEYRESLDETFDEYDAVELTMKSENEEVIYLKGNEAVVKTPQMGRTPEFDETNNYQNNRIALHFVVKQDDGWKFFRSQYVKTNWLKEDGTPDEEGEIFSVEDDTDVWYARVDEMREQDILPSKYLENLEQESAESETEQEIIEERDLDQPSNKEDVITFLIEHYASVYTVDTEADYQQVIAESFLNYDEYYNHFKNDFDSQLYTSVDTTVSVDASMINDISDYRFGAMVNVTFSLTTNDGQTETKTHNGYYEFDRPSVDDNYKIVSIQYLD